MTLWLNPPSKLQLKKIMGINGKAKGEVRRGEVRKREERGARNFRHKKKKMAEVSYWAIPVYGGGRVGGKKGPGKDPPRRLSQVPVRGLRR